MRRTGCCPSRSSLSSPRRARVSSRGRWCRHPHETTGLLPKPLQSQLREEGADVFTGEMLATVARELPTFDQLTKHPFVLFFEPPSLDDRIVNQFALFSVMNGPLLRLDTFLESQKRGVRRL